MILNFHRLESDLVDSKLKSRELYEKHKALNNRFGQMINTWKMFNQYLLSPSETE